mmetsp:Transcript_18551/g.28849  ORF Transcript_18551/g.28849 Transcript_18551/m.28849 type:complete len:379 (+) Transcript_18551:231-1367(+)
MPRSARKSRNKNEQRNKLDALLDWTSKQGRILTAGGLANNFTPLSSFVPTDLPHHHLEDKSTHAAFRDFKARTGNRKNLVCGAWDRALFQGAFEHSSNLEEAVFNIQTNTLFVDIRIPLLRDEIIKNNASDTYPRRPDDVRILSRQHAFAGYTLQEYEAGRPVCTRHHCIDWNFVPNLSVPRSIPNRWWVQMDDTCNVWKEWAYGRDEHGQHYYCERWERLEDDCRGDGFVLALRKSEECDRDGILVVVGNHFNYIHGRKSMFEEGAEKDSTVNLVDKAIAEENMSLAESYLEVEAGHGKISDDGSEWIIDCCTLPWKEGTPFLRDNEEFYIEGNSIDTCFVKWKNERWDVFECSLNCVDELRHIFCFIRTDPISSKL